MSEMERPFLNKTALITGSSRGIGKAIAQILSDKGCNIVLNYTRQGGSSEEQAYSLASEIQAKGCKSLVIRADIASKEAVKEIFLKIRENFDGLDFLILNAARAPFRPLERLFERELKMLVEVNLYGNLFCIKEALPLLEQSKGKIVFISSLGSRFYNPSYPLGIMKAAMEAVVRDLSCSLADKGIIANAVCGGIVKTDSFKILRQLWEAIEELPESQFVEPNEIAHTVAFLCSDESNGIRGQTIVVDRGLSNSLIGLRPKG
jgi:NAD(P)-dependent dehydrogenase (short-subunit alcohol dehydrogenase family)